MTKMDRLSAAVAGFVHGNRYDLYLSVARKGLIAFDNDADAVFSYVMESAPPPAPNPTKLRNAIRYALEHPLPGANFGHRFGPVRHSSFVEKQEKHRRSLPTKARNFVLSLRDRGAGSDVSALMKSLIGAASQANIIDRAAQAAKQLHALGGIVWAGTISNGKRPFANNGIISSLDLAQLIEAGEINNIPTHVSLNPLTGNVGKNMDGKDSFDCLATVSNFRYILLEFDDLKASDNTPSHEQIDIVAGLIDWAQSTGLFHIAFATYSGGKSIHTVLQIPDAESVDEYRKACSTLRDLLASSDDPRYRIDTANWRTGGNAITHVRLAGAIRPETGNVQQLLWCR